MTVINRVFDVSKRLQTPLLRSSTPSFPAFPLRTPQSWPILTLINTSPAGNGNRGFSQRRPPSEPLSGKKWDKSGSHQLKMSRIRRRVKQQAAPSAIGDRNGMGFQSLAKPVFQDSPMREKGASLEAERSAQTADVPVKSSNSPLRELDRSDNDLQDSGVKLISDGLKSSSCQLEILRLSGCMVTEEGCGYLASALNTNPSHLRELDLSYNHPGPSGVQLLSIN
ncbi:putative ribonuclease inhibitor-like [Triplophysa rosa]|uniref:Ribonuclease inhibitor-like n=1 Tax=Triplophysa rosa TaxID=992332 RepID=A0A9W7T6K1_TRIRA|nr:putative ribonuclease inhibitor-like [Triplophysa rosa]